MEEFLKKGPAVSTSIDSRYFRNVLGHYPTGVSIVTSEDEEGTAAGITVGSFTSVSLDPPLVAFLPSRGSSSWPRIQRSGKFGVNVLSEDQHALALKFARPGRDKFEGVAQTRSAQGLPRLHGSAAWIACELYAVYDAGDHEIALGRVIELEADPDKKPLLVLRGSYGAFLAMPPA